MRATFWYGVLVTVFMLVRAGTTLIGGARFALPGDGWRAVFQLVVALAALGCVLAGRRSRLPQRVDQ